MTSRTGLISLAVLAAGALGAAGCGSSSNNNSTTNSGSTTAVKAAATTSGGKTVSVADNGKVGKILVDSKGNTLYLFEQDKTTTSTCSGACASNWPPLSATGNPTAGSGVTASKLGTTKRSDGTMQVTYNGHPLYTFSGDMKPGDAAGQGQEAFGAEWYTLTPSGSKNEGAAKSSSSKSSSSGYGNGY